MNRYIIMTVGKTHSGKTTFANELEKKLVNAVVIDQDSHAEFLQLQYPRLVPSGGPNLLIYALTRAVFDYAVNETDCHLILSNSNLKMNSRRVLLEEFHGKGFTSILVHLDIPDSVLRERVAASTRSTTILRTAASFKEVLDGQQTEAIALSESEADVLITINQTDETANAIARVVELVKGEEE
ncbi:AAA family ATPase [Planococcus sp. N064]|uniref:AAA family ATPase n=1 Tax=Planococcus liqunii TaxID=3058394 RepID=A0ABT8MT15_9BACL|nr:AAA family ATPase [Planococcus sp. N064]MDN7228045.1 AAA family ATPase [Planococcus sp. N064]